MGNKALLIQFRTILPIVNCFSDRRKCIVFEYDEKASELLMVGLGEQQIRRGIKRYDMMRTVIDYAVLHPDTDVYYVERGKGFVRIYLVRVEGASK